VLVDGARVIGFIDWDDLCIGPRLFDLAYYAVHHVKWHIDDDATTRLWLSHLPRLVEGYRSRFTLCEEEAVAFPYAMMAYHLLLSHWHMGLLRLEKVEVELRSLYWMHTNFDVINNAVMPS
jgi:Ser/Thr protein kinase RdoA (MazF antagonist)